MNTPKEEGFYWCKYGPFDWCPVEVLLDEETDTKYFVSLGSWVDHSMSCAKEWGPKIEYPQTITDEEAEYIQNYVDPLRDPARDIYA